MAWRVTMAETPKKITGCEYKCFLCDTLTQSSAGRVRLFGKSAFELPRLIETAICEKISANIATLDPNYLFATLNATRDFRDYKKQRTIWKASKRRSVGFTNPQIEGKNGKEPIKLLRSETKTSHI